VKAFRRCLRGEALSTLRDLAAAPEENWWQELLRLWSPSGAGAGLRLGVRENSLDFYHEGAVVAHVGFGQGMKDEPAPAYVKTHGKYLLGEDAGDGYLKLLEGPAGWAWRGADAPVSFTKIKNAIGSRMERLRKNGSDRRGLEKRGVDRIVGVNSGVIDLEMALPRDAAISSLKEGAPRMDIVALERFEDKLRIVFWEAKTFDDPRLRVDGDGQAEVEGQLETYGKYLTSPDRRKEIVDAYSETCRLLNEFLAMREGTGTTNALYDEAATPGRLDIDEKPRLLIFDNGKRKNINNNPHWERHRKKLEESKVTMLIKDRAEDIFLPKWR